MNTTSSTLNAAMAMFVAVLLSAPPLADAGKKMEAATALLARYCTDCHRASDEDPEGGLSLTADFADASLHDVGRELKKALDAVEGYEMPPAEENQPSAEERRQLIAGLRQLLAGPETAQRNPGRPVLRRLTRLEYNNTVRDLLGLDSDVFMFPERLPFDKGYFNPVAGEMPQTLRIPAREYGAKYPVLLPQAGLPGDSRAEHGFTNRGDAQNLSAVRLEQYVELAEKIAFHPELLQRAERLQEIFPGADYESPQSTPVRPDTPQIVNASGKLAPHDNVAKTTAESDFSLVQFRQRLQQAFAEDRGGVYDVSENANSTIAGKGGVLQLAYGHNASRVLGVNPSEDIWNAAFATAEESSGDGLLTNKQKGRKQFFFGFHSVGGQEFKGIAAVGVVVLSRRGQTGMVRLTAHFEDDRSKSAAIELKAGAGADNTFVAFAAPKGQPIRRLTIDGSDFSGDYVLLDDLAFITRGEAADEPAVTGRELPKVTSREVADEEIQIPAARGPAKIDKSIAEKPPRDRVAHLLKRAFRRPVDDAEVDLYFGLYETAKTDGADDEAALRAVLHGVLSSPSFLYLTQQGQAPDADAEATPLTDHELAVRLSYFLWSSMPDDELLQLAEAGRLQDEAVLAAQARRMLRDARSRELAENFYVEWLRLRELWSAQPDRKQFREFYEGPMGKRTLAPDMFCEALLLFETVLIEDRPVLDLVQTDYAYLNNRMAEHYGIELNTDDDRQWQRVLLDDRRRGGVLTLGATLTLTSFPHRTSPIRRGAWFLETIFHRPPPPPKIAVADIDDQEGLEENVTLREKVELHRAKAACAVCHDRIDPPGFALEKYDAIGRWREQDGQERIDPSGELRGLGAFDGPATFKQRIAENQMRFVRGFVEQLLSYALARKLEYYDVATVEEIIAAAEQDDYRFSRIVVEIAKSPAFRNIQREIR